MLILRILIALMFLSVPTIALAGDSDGCVGSSPTWTTTPDYASISGCISAATAGDTINVSAGNATWTSTLAITKGVLLIGSGSSTSGTVITYTGSGFAWTYNPSNRTANTPFRFSGFRITGSGIQIFELGYTNFQPTAGESSKQTKIRIDNNYFNNGNGARYWYIHGGMFGVVHNNTFTGGWYAGRFDVDYGCYAWKYYGTFPGMSAHTALGHGDNIYFEDNVITLTDTGNQTLVTSTQYGGRWAFRYNTITSTGRPEPLFDFHGNQNTSVQMASSQIAELYGNNITISSDESSRFTDFRGGRSYAFYNNISGQDLSLHVWEECIDTGQVGVNCAAFNAVTGEPMHVSDSHYFLNKHPSGIIVPSVDHGGSTSCGSPEFYYSGPIPENNVDYWQDVSGGGPGNGTTGIGCGTVAQMNAITPTVEGVRFWATNQSCSSLTGMVGVNPSTPISGTMYKNVSGTWTPHYTPYTYPHPLRSESGDGTAPSVTITHIDGSANQSATYTTTSSSVTLAGTVYDAVGVITNGVTWYNNRGPISGTATCASCNGTAGTKDWSKTNIDLQVGVNVITITGRDAANNTGPDILTVTYTLTDTEPPVISSPLPSGQQLCTGAGVANVALSVVTNESSTCRMALTDIAYASMTYTFTTTGSLNHSETKSLTCGPAYTYYVRCSDVAGNPTTTSTPISFWVVKPGVEGGISIPGGVAIQ